MSTSIDACDAGTGALPEGFAELPPLVYGDDPRWIPEDPLRLRGAMSPLNPWFKRGRARLFSNPGRGRVAAFFDPLAQLDQEPVGFFGLWESRGSSAEDAGLLDAAGAWCRQQGARRLLGPIDFSTLGSSRLLLHAESDHVPFPGEPYNPRDYPERLEIAGLRLRQRYQTYVFEPDRTREMIVALDPWRRRLHRAGYRIETATAQLWAEGTSELLSVANDVFADNLAFTPITVEEFALACGADYIAKACPHSSIVARAPDGRIAGFFIGFPDYGAIVTQSAGSSRISAGVLKFVSHAAAATSKRRRSLAKTLGVATEWRHRGLYPLLMAEFFERTFQHYDSSLGALIRSGNESEKLPARYARPIRSYGMFERAL